MCQLRAVWALRCEVVKEERRGGEGWLWRNGGKLVE